MRYRRVAGALVFAGSFAVAGPAMAQTYVGVAPQQVGAVDASSGARGQVGAVDAASGSRNQVSGVNAVAARAGGLAFTGADIMELLLIAGSSVAVGSAVVRLSRSRPTA